MWTLRVKFRTVTSVVLAASAFGFGACGGGKKGAETVAKTGLQSATDCRPAPIPETTDQAEMVLAALKGENPSFTYLVDFDLDGFGVCEPFLPPAGRNVAQYFRSHYSVDGNAVTFYWGGGVLSDQFIDVAKIGKDTGLWTPVDAARMGQTRALDGTVASADGKCTWTYHPDNGLTVICAIDNAIV